MSARTPSSPAPALPAATRSTSSGRGWRRLVAALLTLSVVIASSYTAISLYIATQLVYVTQIPLYATPASLGLQYKDVPFPSRDDHLQLQGWFIPGVLKSGSLTAERTIIVVHGNQANRADRSVGLLELSAAFARHGFAVLAFDVRGNGQSPPAPRSFGYFEQRDVLGAVDFLRAGILALTQAGAALARLLFADAGSFAQQQAAVIVLIAGLILAIAAFGLAVWRVLPRVALWQQGEARARANAALWALGASALVIVMPVLLALLLPQHPFP